MQTEIYILGGLEYHRDILNALPSPVFVVDEDVRILDFNHAAGFLLNDQREVVLKRRAGEVLHCLHSIETPEGCGHAPMCETCPVRNAVANATKGRASARQAAKLEWIQNGRKTEALFMITVAPLKLEEMNLAVMIFEDMREVELLRKIVPICSRCKQVRNDYDYWQSVESYLDAYLDIDCTHSLCPQCAKDMFPEYPELLKDPSEAG